MNYKNKEHVILTRNDNKVCFLVLGGRVGKKKAAFTLAEVLITLGVIGVVAAMTIPSLIQKYSNERNSAILKEDYSILQQMMLSANDNGVFINLEQNDDTNERKWFEEYFMPYIKTAHVCYGESGCWSNNIKNLRGEVVYNGDVGCGQGSVTFVLNNGSYICIDAYGTNTVDVGLLIDVNGSQKPNIIGKDIFVVLFKDEKFLPGGYNKTKDEIENNCSKNCSGDKYSCGEACLIKAKNQGFKLPVVK